MLQVGQKAPFFIADSTKGQIDMKKYIGKQPIVFIFYPKDDTMICTKQLCAVTDSKTQYAKYNAFVVGVNPGSLEQHQQFASKYMYDFPLISDQGEQINQLYRVGSQLLTFLGQHRVVYVVDLEGNIAYAKRGNRPTNEILAVLESSIGMKQ